ncbi:MAG: hypothetical protein PVJ62_05085 [Deltaproteobacteria bacterium]|jgi:phosphoribosylanthranilate isomerase
MTRIEVQIYEIQDPVEAEAVIGLGVDRIGSVILSEEHWKIPAIRKAVFIAREAGVKHSLIPLFQTKHTLFQVIAYYNPHIIHFCEALTDEQGSVMPHEPLVELQGAIKEHFPDIKIMRTIPVGLPERSRGIPTIEIAGRFEGASDLFLTDTSIGSEPVSGFIGITGRTGDWAVARQLVESTAVPVILAGGLSPTNVYDAVMAVKPFGVDSCTATNVVGMNGKPVRFKKDYDRVEAFVREVRRAERDLSPHT